MQKDPAAAYLVSRLLSNKRADALLQPFKDFVDSDVDADRIDATASMGYFREANSVTMRGTPHPSRRDSQR